MYHRKIETIFLHHSASLYGDTKAIDEWHKKRGFTGKVSYDGENHIYHIGYHFVISPTGLVEMGKPLDLPGEHVKGDNLHSIGICIIGTGDGESHTYTQRQIDSAIRLCSFLKMLYPSANIKGHKEYDGKKPFCPSIDMDDFRTKVFDYSIRRAT